MPLLDLASSGVREQTESLYKKVRGSNYYGEIEARLASLPAEIAARVDVDKVANEMREIFRQQLTSMGFETSAVLLRSTAAETTALAGHLSMRLKPIAQDFKILVGSLADGISTLGAHSGSLESHGSQFAESARPQSWLWHFILILAVFPAGDFCGLITERSRLPMYWKD